MQDQEKQISWGVLQEAPYAKAKRIEKIYHWRLYVKPWQAHGFSVDGKGFAHNLQWPSFGSRFH
jgi:hypothetical protein